MKLTENVDYYLEDGKFVLTEAFLLKRGYCCHSDCRHCPYRPQPEEKQDENSGSETDIV